jgi:prepilin signal peptidase PulO-like enzyme (type II secretory pathway)
MLDIGPNLLAFSYFTYFFIFLCGLILGSFLNSWIWRTRENIKVISSGSFSICPCCRRPLKWYEKFPVLSFVFLRGKCRTCHKPIPWHYTAMEIVTPILLLAISLSFLNSEHFSEWHFLRDVLFLTFLIIVFVYDVLYQEVLSRIVWPGFFLGFLINYFALNYSFDSLMIGAAVGGCFFLLQYFVSHGKWIGGGDVRLGFMMGVWLGWPNILVALFLSYILGAIVSVGLLVFKRKKWASEIPFGTFLAIGTLVSLYYATDLINWYLGLLR